MTGSRRRGSTLTPPRVDRPLRGALAAEASLQYVAGVTNLPAGRSQLRSILLWTLPPVVALLARIFTGPHAIDDAYITFRYARNLADGLGLVYNPGEWVLGTTAPLWAIVLAGGYKLGFTDLPWLATLVAAVCDAASVALLVRFSMTMGWRPLGATLVGLAWALNPMSIAFATGGMETSLFVLLSLVVLGLTAWTKNLPIAAGLAGVAMLVRPEGALLAVVVVGWTFLCRRSQTVLAALVAATPMGIGALTFWLRYGSPLPNSVAAKQVAYLQTWSFENAVALLLQAGLPGWSTYLLAQLPAALGLGMALLGLGALVMLIRRGIPWLQSQSLPWLPFAAFAALYVAFYVSVGLRGVRLFPWYLVPIEPFYLLGAAAGLATLTGRGSLARTRPAAEWSPASSALRGTSWLAAALVLWQLPAVDWHQPLLPAGENHAREEVMLELGYRLAESLPPTAVIAAPEIGALGYASNLRILDTVGLVSPVAIKYYPLPREQVLTDNAIPARLIIDQHPDVVVTLDAFAQRSLLPDEAFQRDYALERSIPASVWQSAELLVFRRTDARDAKATR
jgi:arabinofuranosyltransferase